MSTAHRPTWDPAQARDTKAGSRQFSTRDMPSHTKLKFRQVGQTSSSEVQKRDLKYELLLAEHEAKNKKRKAEGMPEIEFEYKQPAGAIESGNGEGEDTANKRRKILEEVGDLDKDDDDEDAPDVEDSKDKDKAMDSDEEDSDEDSDEDDTDELLRELEKIKRERAEEKAKQEASQNAEREAEIATKNPLLNLAAALGQETPRSGVNTTVPGTFSVKRRWDDDLIFKNQAMSSRDKGQGQFVNDLLRTEFHKKFMAKFIK